MAVYVGFSTQAINQPQFPNQFGPSGKIKSVAQLFKINKKYALTDEQLVIQDLINAFSIKQGDKVGNPQYGTSLADFIFDPNVPDVIEEIKTEVIRVAGLDPRLIVNNVTAYSQENGILIEVQVAIKPFNNPIDLALFINQDTGSIQRVISD